MHTVGRLLRGLLLAVIALLFVNVVFVGLLLSSLSVNLTDQEKVVGWVANQQAYEGLMAALPSMLGQQLEGPPEGEEAAGPAFDSAAYIEHVSGIITYERYQRLITDVSDGMYGWLEGETVYPEIRLSIARDKAEFIDILAGLFAAKVQSAPPCTAEQLPLLSSDPIQWECRPENFEPSIIKDQIVQNQDHPELQKFFEQASQQKIIIGENQQGDGPKLNPETSERVQRGYKIFRLVPPLFIGVVLLLAGLITLLLWSPRRGLGASAKILLFPTGLAFLAALALWLSKARILDQIIASLPNVNQRQAITTARPVFETAFSDILQTYLLLSGALLLLAVATLLVLWRLRKTPEPTVIHYGH